MLAEVHFVSALRRLAPDTIERLLAVYARARDGWFDAPVAETRAQLAAIDEAMLQLAAKLRALGPGALAVAGIPAESARGQAAWLVEQAAAFSGGVAQLDLQGAARGGRRRVGHLLRQRPPRQALAMALRVELAAARVTGLGREEELDMLAELLAEAGEAEPWRGLERVLRSLPRWPEPPIESCGSGLARFAGDDRVGA
jgi:hypothetical protein